MQKMSVREIECWAHFPKQINLVSDARLLWVIPRKGRPLWVFSFPGKIHKVVFTLKLPSIVHSMLGKLIVGRLVLIGALREKW